MERSEAATPGSGQAQERPVLFSLGTLEETHRQSEEESLEPSTAGVVMEYENSSIA